MKLKVWTSYGQGNPRQSGPGPDVDHHLAGIDSGVDNGTVEHVPFPEARDLTGSDQPVRYPAIGQNRRELLSQRQAIAKDFSSGGWWWRRRLPRRVLYSHVPRPS
jgi:hypothetical protein